MKPMQLLLLSGFLGSGKTTFIIKLARYAVACGKKVAILVNEIGSVGIDNQLMRQLDLNVWELLNGCICCTLKTDLVSTLQELDSDYSADIVIIEPSGAADPQNVIDTLAFYKGTPIESVITVSILDPLRLKNLFEALSPLIISQIRCADFILISKSDLANSEEVQSANQLGQEYNSDARIINFGMDTPVKVIMKEILPWLN